MIIGRPKMTVVLCCELLTLSPPAKLARVCRAISGEMVDSFCPAHSTKRYHTCTYANFTPLGTPIATYGQSSLAELPI